MGQTKVNLRTLGLKGRQRSGQSDLWARDPIKNGRREAFVDSQDAIIHKRSDSEAPEFIHKQLKNLLVEFGQAFLIKVEVCRNLPGSHGLHAAKLFF